MGTRSGGEVDFFKTLLLFFAFFFIILALAGPQWGERLESVELQGIEIMFLLDTSNSMNAEDLKPNRLEVAKTLINDIVTSLNTDFVGLVNFSGLAYVQCPLTPDYEAFKLMVSATSISPPEEQGTDFGEAFALALKTFPERTESTRILMLITDGEDQEGAWQQSVADLKELGIITFTVGVGALSGAPIPIKNENNEITGWKKDKAGNIVRSRLDETALLRIAAEMEGQYFRLADLSGIDPLVEAMKSFERQILSRRMKSQKVHRFQYPLFLGIILLIFEMILTKKRLPWTKE